MSDTRLPLRCVALVDRKTHNVLGEFQTRAEAEEMLHVLISHDPRARDDVELVEA